MADTYTLDGTAASFAPFSVEWSRVQIGTDHRGAPVFAMPNNIICRFPPGSPTYARQWLSLEDSASHTITMLGPESTKFYDLSPVWVTVTERPEMTDINSSEFTIMITGSSRPNIT